MPPLPQNGTSYPPSCSGYQPLNRDDDDDLESRLPTSSHIAQRTFSHSPYRSRANDPTDLVQTLLADTRPRGAPPKKLFLRITVRRPNSGGAKSLDLPLPVLTLADSIPFALADDVPCLRGLPAEGPRTWRQRLRRVVRELTNTSATTSRPTSSGAALQVFNTSQNKPLYATSDEIDRYRARSSSNAVPPWTPLNDEFLPPAPAASAQEENTDQDVDKLFDASGGMGDFDLSSVFARTRHRKTSRLVGAPLQEAIERFVDDRHFSKWLKCRECVWGWDFEMLKRRIREVANEVEGKGKGKGKAKARDVADEDEIEVEVEVTGLDAKVYHVVWSPIAYLTRRCPTLFDSRTSLLALVALSTLFVTSVLLSLMTNTLVILVALLTLSTWAALTRLIRTQHACVYDTIGTAWSLAPRWVKLDGADPAWEHDRVVQSLDVDAGDAGKIERRGAEGAWCIRKGLDPEEWLQTHRERLARWIEE